MEREYKKIFWKIGQEITPETFIHADNYICSQQNLIRSMITYRYYGLLPQLDGGAKSLIVKASMSNKDINVEKLDCYGVTGNGSLIEFENIMLLALQNKRLSIPYTKAKVLYIVLRVNPFEQVLIEPVEDEEKPQGYATYELDIKELDRIEGNELAILKIDNIDSSPEIVDDYIPPCMSIDSSDKLTDCYGKFKKLFEEIQSQINLKKAFYHEAIYPLQLLQFDFDEFPLSEPPIALIRLIKKIIRTYTFFIPDIRQVEAVDFSAPYNHNDVMDVLRPLLKYLHEVRTIVSKEEKPVIIEEDFTPKI